MSQKHPRTQPNPKPRTAPPIPPHVLNCLTAVLALPAKPTFKRTAYAYRVHEAQPGLSEVVDLLHALGCRVLEYSER